MKTKLKTTRNKIYPINTSINSKGHLCIGNLDMVELANKFGTPLYILDKETVSHNLSSYINSIKKYYANFLVLYAAKSLACKEIFRIINKSNSGIDVVSGGEFYLGLKIN